jgi:hypothetical protein
VRDSADDAAVRTRPTGALAGTSPPTDERPAPLVQAISRGSQQAFVVLFDCTAASISAELTTRLADPEQRVAILAAAYVEVWWLAGCRSGAEPDITDWIRRILDRRIADVRQTAGQQVEREPRPGRAELELASLLGRSVEHLWPV